MIMRSALFRGLKGCDNWSISRVTRQARGGGGGGVLRVTAPTQQAPGSNPEACSFFSFFLSFFFLFYLFFFFLCT